MRRDRLAQADVLSRDDCTALAQQVFGMVAKIPGAKAELRVSSEVSASTEFARGDVHVSTEIRRSSISLSLTVRDRPANVSSNRLDRPGLELLVAAAEAAARQWRGTPHDANFLGPQIYKTPPRIHFEQNMPFMTADGRAAIVMAALDATEAAALVGAGNVHLSRSSSAILNTAGLFGFTIVTLANFSLTARTKDGTGSGWAWSGHEDWRRVDTGAVIARAVDLARRSANPVAVEPGRYTVILEPNAVAGLISPINFNARTADRGGTVFSNELPGTNKIGLQMLDDRLNLVSDPWDPEAPRSTVSEYGEAVDTVVWFRDGVLMELAYDRPYAEDKGREPVFSGNRRLYGKGPTQTLEEMVASTKRGIWVNRLSHVEVMDQQTLLLTGTTRDGTFLIENGKIAKAIKNFRFTESPFFVLNSLEAFGTPIRASGNVVAPRLKVRDFNFTSLTDAI